MINMDGPTAGFAVDDVKLEAGDKPTPFLDIAREGLTVELLGEVPGVIASKTDAGSFRSFLYASEAAAGARLSAAVTGDGDTKLAAQTVRVDLPKGLHEVRLAWEVRGLAHQPCRLSLAVAGEKGILAEQVGDFELYTLSSYNQAKAGALRAQERLSQSVEKAQRQGKRVPYGLSARAVLQRFVDLAEKKLAADVLPEAVTDLEFLAKLGEQAAENTDAVIAGTAADRLIPEPRLDQATIRAGNFWVGDEPVMIVGGMGYNEIKAALPTMRDFGFNTVGDDYDNGYSCLQMMTAPGEHDGTAVPKLRASWEELRLGAGTPTTCGSTASTWDASSGRPNRPMSAGGRSTRASTW